LYLQAVYVAYSTADHWKVCDLPLYENQGWNHKTPLSFTRVGEWIFLC